MGLAVAAGRAMGEPQRQQGHHSWKRRPPFPGRRFVATTLCRIRGFQVAENSQHASTAFVHEAAQAGAVKRTAAEPRAFGARYPRTFGDVLGVPGRHRYGPVCGYLMLSLSEPNAGRTRSWLKTAPPNPALPLSASVTRLTMPGEFGMGLAQAKKTQKLKNRSVH